METPSFRIGNAGRYPLQRWNIKCKNEKNVGKGTNFGKATKTNSFTGDTGATILSRIGDNCMYI